MGLFTRWIRNNIDPLHFRDTPSGVTGCLPEGAAGAACGLRLRTGQRKCTEANRRAERRQYAAAAPSGAHLHRNLRRDCDHIHDVT